MESDCYNIDREVVGPPVITEIGHGQVRVEYPDGQVFIRTEGLTVKLPTLEELKPGITRMNIVYQNRLDEIQQKDHAAFSKDFGMI
jgi:hypothetical protein